MEIEGLNCQIVDGILYLNTNSMTYQQEGVLRFWNEIEFSRSSKIVFSPHFQIYPSTADHLSISLKGLNTVKSVRISKNTLEHDFLEILKILQQSGLSNYLSDFEVEADLFYFEPAAILRTFGFISKCKNLETLRVSSEALEIGNPAKVLKMFASFVEGQKQIKNLESPARALSFLSRKSFIQEKNTFNGLRTLNCCDAFHFDQFPVFLFELRKKSCSFRLKSFSLNLTKAWKVGSPSVLHILRDLTANGIISDKLVLHISGWYFSDAQISLLVNFLYLASYQVPKIICKIQMMPTHVSIRRVNALNHEELQDNPWRIDKDSFGFQLYCFQ
eukprot:snap_masked-scaffold_8-processed-gene-6.22-mRNA-1 protein AED:0.82 eAED:1.00 QI:0/-1/0/1/-1/1/1/0/330